MLVNNTEYQQTIADAENESFLVSSSSQHIDCSW
jgi:hypothetical protein